VLAVGLVLSVVLIGFEVTAVATALPTISDELGGDSLYGVSLAIYTLANMVSLVAAGEASDRWGPLRPFLVAMAVFVIGLVVAAVASSMLWVVAGRTLQGANGAFGPIAYSLVRRAFPEQRQPMLYALLGAGWVVPSLLGPFAAGWITDAFGWRWVFIVVIPLAVGVTAFIARPMARFGVRPDGLGEDGATAPWRGSRVPTAALAACGVGLVAFGLSTDRIAVGLALAGTGVGVALPALRRLLPLGTFVAASGLAAAVAVRVLATASFGGADQFIPLAADRVHGIAATWQGFMIIGASLTWTAGQWIAARRTTVGAPTWVASGAALLAVGVVGCIPIVAESWPLWTTFASWSLGGLGMGLLFNPTTVTAMSYAREGNEGEVSSQIALADSLGFSLIGAVGGSTVALADRESVTISTALLICFAIAVACAAVVALIARRVRPAPA
jgi:MFS family permease